MHNETSSWGVPPPCTDRQDHLPAPINISDTPGLSDAVALAVSLDLYHLAAEIDIFDEHPFVEVTDREVDRIIPNFQGRMQRTGPGP